MTAQDEFDSTYITSSEIGRRLQVTRNAVIQARQQGRLPEPIFIEKHLVIWKRITVEPHIVEWENRRKDRIGV